MKQQKLFVIKKRLGNEMGVASRTNSATIQSFKIREKEEVEEGRRDLKELINITNMKRQDRARLPMIIRRGKREVFRYNEEREVKFFGRKLRYQTRLGIKEESCDRISVATKTTNIAKMSLMFLSLALFALISHVNVRLGEGK